MTTKQLLGRGVLVVAIALAAGAIAYLVSDNQERTYEATTKLLFSGSTPELRALGLSSGQDDEERAFQNAVEQVDSFDIARRTAERMADPRFDADAIDARVTALGETNSDVVTIRVHAESPQLAAEIASIYRREFTLQQKEIVSGRAQSARETTREALLRLSPGVRAGPRGESLRTQLALLALLERSGGEPLIVEGVRALRDPVTPDVSRNTLFGLLFGAVLGVGLVALRGATVARRQPAATGEPAASSS
jgi:capsular polysaccharide biosynthesis protein